MYVKCSKIILKKRNKKNLYIENKVEKYQEGRTKDITINSYSQSGKESAQKIFKYLINKKKLEKN